jgi:signal transduction histidine kinase
MPATRSASKTQAKGVIGLQVLSAALIVILAGVKLSHAASTEEMLELPLLVVLVLANVMVLNQRTSTKSTDLVPVSVDLWPEHVRTIIRDTSHELRTPITIARGYTELLWEASKGRKTISDVEVVLDELNRLSRLTDRLLVLAAAGDPQFLVTDEVDVESLIVGQARRWSAAAPRDWKVYVEGDEPLEADVDRLASALDALVENAVQHTVEGDEIAIESRSKHGVVTIAVRDQGSGIPSEQLPGLFEYLARDGVIRPRRVGGTGLGLPIVKAIAEAHRGWVTVTSRPDFGTTFSIHLPSGPVRLAAIPSLGLPVSTTSPR